MNNMILKREALLCNYNIAINIILQLKGGFINNEKTI